MHRVYIVRVHMNRMRWCARSNTIVLVFQDILSFSSGDSIESKAMDFEPSFRRPFFVFSLNFLSLSHDDKKNSRIYIEINSKLVCAFYRVSLFTLNSLL